MRDNIRRIEEVPSLGNVPPLTILAGKALEGHLDLDGIIKHQEEVWSDSNIEGREKHASPVDGQDKDRSRAWERFFLASRSPYHRLGNQSRKHGEKSQSDVNKEIFDTVEYLQNYPAHIFVPYLTKDPTSTTKNAIVDKIFGQALSKVWDKEREELLRYRIAPSDAMNAFDRDKQQNRWSKKRASAIGEQYETYALLLLKGAAEKIESERSDWTRGACFRALQIFHSLVEPLLTCSHKEVREAATLHPAIPKILSPWRGEGRGHSAGTVSQALFHACEKFPEDRRTSLGGLSNHLTYFNRDQRNKIKAWVAELEPHMGTALEQGCLDAMRDDFERVMKKEPCLLTDRRDNLEKIASDMVNDPSYKQDALRLLSRDNDGENVVTPHVLYALLRHSDPQVRESAIKTSAFHKVLRDSTKMRYIFGQSTLQANPSRAADFIDACLSSKSKVSDEVVVSILENFTDPEVRTAYGNDVGFWGHIAAGASSTVPGEQRAVMKVLDKWGNANAHYVRNVMRLLDSQDPSIRTDAAGSLARHVHSDWGNQWKVEQTRRLVLKLGNHEDAALLKPFMEKMNVPGDPIATVFAHSRIVSAVAECSNGAFKKAVFDMLSTTAEKKRIDSTISQGEKKARSDALKQLAKDVLATNGRASSPVKESRFDRTFRGPVSRARRVIGGKSGQGLESPGR